MRDVVNICVGDARARVHARACACACACACARLCCVGSCREDAMPGGVLPADISV